MQKNIFSIFTMSPKRASLIYLQWANICGSVMTVLISGFVLITCLKEMQCPPEWIGLISLLSTLGALCAWPLNLLTQHWNYKHTTIIFLFLGRTALVLMPMALLGLTGTQVYVWLVSAQAISVFASDAAVVAGNAWFKGIIPNTILGRYIGLRTALGMVVAGVLTPLVGYGLNWLKSENWITSQKFSLLFAGALLFGWLDIFLLSRAERSATPPRQPFNQIFARIRALAGERRLWHVPFLMAGVESAVGFAGPYLLLAFYDLHLTEVQVAWIAVSQTLTAAAGFYFGGRWTDRGKNRAILNISLIGRTAGYFSAAGVIFFEGKGYIHTEQLFLEFLFIFGWINFLNGLAGIVYTKMQFQAVPRPDVCAFALMDFIKNCLALPLNALIVGIGARLIRNGPTFEFLGLPLHYAAILTGLSAAGGLLCLLIINRSSQRAILPRLLWSILIFKLMLKKTACLHFQKLEDTNQT